MSKENLYTSTGNKLVNHPVVITQLQNNRAIPISIQVSPTSKCQLNCVFCSNTNRDKHEELEYINLIDFLADMRSLGAKTVEWTGGGDPSLYSNINQMILAAAIGGFEQGFITNGLGFDKIERETLNFLSWIRISMNCLDYVEDIEIPELSKRTTLGFSYVLNAKSTLKSLSKLKAHVKKYNPSYVRIVPDCQTSEEQQEKNNRNYSKWVAKWKAPFFYQAKVFEKPRLCYWGYLKPFLLHDGFVYRCSSVVLNDDAERSFHNKYRWCEMSELKNKYKEEVVPFSAESCDHCVFTKQNNLVHEIINPLAMKNFI